MNTASRTPPRATTPIGLTVAAALVIGAGGAALVVYQRAQGAKQAALAQRRASWDALQRTLARDIRAFQGTSGIVIKDLETGWEFTFQPQRRFAAASIIKVAMMAACLRAAERGELPLAEAYALTAADRVAGSGHLKAMPAGATLTIEELIRLMIAESDNTATNILIKRLTLPFFSDYFTAIGLRDTNLSRLMMDFESRARGVENYTTARDTAHVLERLVRGELLSRGMTERAMAFLKQQKYRDRIPGALPKTLEVAHKTGLERNVCHDAGIVFTPKGAYLIAVFTHHAGVSAPAKRYIRTISRHVYEYMMGEPPDAR